MALLTTKSKRNKAKKIQRITRGILLKIEKIKLK